MRGGLFPYAGLSGGLIPMEKAVQQDTRMTDPLAGGRASSDAFPFSLGLSALWWKEPLRKEKYRYKR